jgi:hypothetical protein
MTTNELRTIADRFLTYLAQNPSARERLAQIEDEPDTTQIPELMVEYINELLRLEPEPLEARQFAEFARQIQIIVSEMPCDLRKFLILLKAYNSPTAGHGGQGGQSSTDNGDKGPPAGEDDDEA